MGYSQKSESHYRETLSHTSDMTSSEYWNNSCWYQIGCSPNGWCHHSEHWNNSCWYQNIRYDINPNTETIAVGIKVAVNQMHVKAAYQRWKSGIIVTLERSNWCWNVCSAKMSNLASKLGQFGPKWEESGTFEDHFQYILARWAQTY